MNMLTLVLVAILNFSDVDAKTASSSDYEACVSELERMLPQAREKMERSRVLWRLSRAYLLIGEQKTSKESRKEFFSRGIKYGEQAIAADPKNPDCYMWHNANVGRECQTRSLPEQAKAVPVMMKDLSMILETLGCVEYSAAWQALAEIYFNHPFKSNDDAVNFSRRAAMTIPSGEMRLSSYILLAKILMKRDASASKRSSIISSNASKKSDGNIEKYSRYDGMLGGSSVPKWAKKSLSAMSDREEAAAVLNYAAGLYTSATTKTSIDNKDYKEIQTLLNKL